MGIGVPPVMGASGQLQPKREGRHRWVLVHIHPVAEAEIRRSQADGRAVHVDAARRLSDVRCYDCHRGLDAMGEPCAAERSS